MKSLGVHRNHRPHLPLMSHWPPQASWFSWLSLSVSLWVFFCPWKLPAEWKRPGVTLVIETFIYFESWILMKPPNKNWVWRRNCMKILPRMKGGKAYVTSTLQVGNFIFCIKDMLKHNIPPLWSFKENTKLGFLKIGFDMSKMWSPSCQQNLDISARLPSSLRLKITNFPLQTRSKSVFKTPFHSSETKSFSKKHHHHFWLETSNSIDLYYNKPFLKLPL